MKAIEYLKREREIKKHCADVTWGYYDKSIDEAIKEIEDLKAENRAFKKTLDMYFDEMIELRKSNKELLNTVIEAQKVIKNVLEFKK